MNLQALLEQLEPKIEEEFTYFEVSELFDVSINTIESGVFIDTHTHNTEVFNYLLSGAISLSVEGKQLDLKQGDWVQIEKLASHSLKTLEKTCLLEFWKK